MRFKRTSRPKLADVRRGLDKQISARETPHSDGPSVLDILLDPSKTPPESRRVAPPVRPNGASSSRELQRAVPRQPVDWEARYRFRNDPSGQWHECRVSDISTAGAGLMLFDAEAEDLEGRDLVVQVQLNGSVRNVVTGMKRDVRVGIEFGDLQGDSASYVDALKRSRDRW